MLPECLIFWAYVLLFQVFLAISVSSFGMRMRWGHGGYIFSGRIVRFPGLLH